MQLVLDEKVVLNSTQRKAAFGRKVGIITSLFGCWHKNLSRPFTHEQESYCVCLDCGARRQFDTQTLAMRGSFYFPPDIALYK